MTTTLMCVLAFTASAESSSVPSSAAVDASDAVAPPESRPWLVILEAGFAHGVFHRAHGNGYSTRVDGVATTESFRLFPTRWLGATLAVTVGYGLFGPAVVVAEAGYTLRVAPERHYRGFVSGDLMLGAGPSLGFVGMSDRDHGVVGAHASVVAHLVLGRVFALGLSATYRLGGALAGRDGLSGMFTVGPTLVVIVNP